MTHNNIHITKKKVQKNNFYKLHPQKNLKLHKMTGEKSHHVLRLPQYHCILNNYMISDKKQSKKIPK